MPTVSILTATFGWHHWASLAARRALPSAQHQGALEVLTDHYPAHKGVSEPRNQLAAQASGNWLCFLDADDELAPGYIRAMKTAITLSHDNPELLFTPQVAYQRRHRRKSPRFWAEVDLTYGNWLVIGTLIHRTLFHAVGGFRDTPHGLEDWALWSRCHRAGATVVKVPGAVYIAHQEARPRGYDLRHDRRGYRQEYDRLLAEMQTEPTPVRVISG